MGPVIPKIKAAQRVLKWLGMKDFMVRVLVI